MNLKTLRVLIEQTKDLPDDTNVVVHSTMYGGDTGFSFDASSSVKVRDMLHINVERDGDDDVECWVSEEGEDKEMYDEWFYRDEVEVISPLQKVVFLEVECHEQFHN